MSRCAFRLILPLASRLISPSTSIVSLLLVESSLIAFLPVLSTTVMLGLSSESSRVMVWPSRDLMILLFTLPVGPTTDGAFSGGLSCPFHRHPTTYGKLTSPCSKASRTSSPTSGKKKKPLPPPVIGVARRAQWLSSLPSHGNLTFTRPYCSSLLLVTTPTNTPVSRPPPVPPRLPVGWLPPPPSSAV